MGWRATATPWITRTTHTNSGPDKDGILLLISMEDRDWAISTCGYGITAFTDAGIDYIMAQMQDDLSAGSYAAAFDTYVTLCDTFITQARNGTPVDTKTLPRAPLSAIWILISIGVGVLHCRRNEEQAEDGACAGGGR